MKVLVTVMSLVVGSTVAGNAQAADGIKLPGLGKFGIAPAPSKLIVDQLRGCGRR